MNPKTILLLLGALLIGGAGIFALRESRAAGSARAALAKQSEQREHLAASLRDTGANVHAAEQRRTELARELASQVATKPVVTAPTSAKKELSARDLLLTDPKVQGLWLASTRARLAREYGPLFARLKLTPDEIEKALAAMTKREEAKLDLASVSESQGPEAKKAVATLSKQAEADYEAAQTANIGVDGLREVKNYERLSVVRLLVERLGGSATVESVPLQSGQADQIAQIVANASPSYVNGGSVDLRSTNWEQVDLQVQQILTPRQFQIYRSGIRMEIQLETTIAKVVKEEQAAKNAAKTDSGS